MTQTLEKDQCPRCGGGIPNDAQRGAYPGALSRWDNATYICSACGHDEAMRDLIGNGWGWTDLATKPLDRSQWWDQTGVRP